MLLFLFSIFLLSIYYFHFYIGTNYESNFMEIFFTQTVNFLDFSFIQQAPIKVFSPSLFKGFYSREMRVKSIPTINERGLKLYDTCH